MGGDIDIIKRLEAEIHQFNNKQVRIVSDFSNLFLCNYVHTIVCSCISNMYSSSIFKIITETINQLENDC